MKIKSKLTKARARHGGASVWPAVVFLIGAACLITFVSLYYLIPALRAASNADKSQQQSIAAYSLLLLAVILLILFCGLLLTFKFGRMFFPGKQEPRTKTKYVDAWAEAGKRLDAVDNHDKP